MSRRLPVTTTLIESGESRAIHEKRMANLARANRVRSRKAKVKARLRSGELSLREFVLAVPPEVRTAGVFEILCEARGIGPARAKQIMDAARLPARASFSWLRAGPRDRLLDAIAEVRPAAHDRRPKVRREAVPA